jgi:4-hydroxyphenylpyruvate dioxygenase
MTAGTISPHRRSVASRALSLDLGAAIDAAAEVGFAGMEVWVDDAQQVPGGLAAVRRRLGDAGIVISAAQLIRDVETLSNAAFDEAFSACLRQMDGAAELGAGLLLVAASSLPGEDCDADRAVRHLRRLADAARERHLELCFEGLSFSTCFGDWTAANALVAEVGRDNLGLLIDIAHVAIRGNPVDSIASLPAERLRLVHIVDLPRLDGDRISLNREQRCFPGEGILHFGRFCDAVEASGYTGFYSLEVFNAVNRALPPGVVAARAMRSFDVLEAQMNQRVSA